MPGAASTSEKLATTRARISLIATSGEWWVSAPMELRHLRYFIAVAEVGAFSRAAARLHITQPALWRQGHDLEIELGVRLFERAGRRSEGEGLMGRSRELLDGVDQLAEHAHAMRRRACP